MRAHWCWQWETSDFLQLSLWGRTKRTSSFSSLFHLLAGFKPKEILNPFLPPSLSHPKDTGWLTPRCRLRRGRSPKGWVFPKNWEKTVPYFLQVSREKAGVTFRSVLLCVHVLFSYDSWIFPLVLQQNFSPGTLGSSGKERKEEEEGKEKEEGEGEGKEKPPSWASYFPPPKAKAFHIFIPHLPSSSSRTWCVVGRHLTVLFFPEKKISLKKSKELKREKRLPLGEPEKLIQSLEGSVLFTAVAPMPGTLPDTL